MLTKIKNILALSLSSHSGLPIDQLVNLLELPKDSSHGDLAFPCFALAKLQRKSPMLVAGELATKIYPVEIKKVQVVGGYLNFFFDDKSWQDILFSQIQGEQENVGNTLVGKNKTVVIDYSSPNVAKPMSIGHLRSTVIGQSIVNLFKSAGYKTIGINYIGDWGVQFGKLAWAHLNHNELIKYATLHTDKIISKGFAKDYWEKLMVDARKTSPINFDYLFAVYVIFHAVAEEDKNLEDFGRQYFLKLEQRQISRDSLTEKIERAWEEFIQVSLKEYGRVYETLRTKHDLTRGESYYEDHLPHVVQELKDKKLLVESQGAMIVDLEPYQMPPCLIQKSDGATLYATRDIAAALNRKDEFKADKLIYVVGAEQSLHFKQFFKVLDLMGYSWVKDCEHVGFGLYRFKEGKMSTRRGNVVLLEDVLDRAVELVENVIKEKNPDLKNPKEVARQVGTGAVVFNDLMNDRIKNIDFDWEKLLDFNGDTGPYVQYTHVRCCSVMAKWKAKGNSIPKFNELSVLKESHEKEVLRVLGQFEDVVKISLDQLKPSWVAQYLLTLSKAFNSFYYEHRILEGDVEVQKNRIVLVDSVRIVLQKGLSLLGIEAPQAM